MSAIDLSRVPAYFHRYIGHMHETDLSSAFQKHQTEAYDVLQSIPEERWSYRYAEGKWSIKEVVQHLIDAERIFGYRALCFARQDKTPLPGFEENDYAAASRADERSKESLLEELATVQRSTAQLFASFNEEQLDAEGISNNKPTHVRAIGAIVIGHVRHHLAVLRERYGVE